MNNQIAYCGINCSSCPLYVATLNDYVAMKKEILLQYEKIYNRTFDIENMECHGCKSGEKFFLSNNCNITPCNISKGINTCSHCTNYPCERINRFYKWQKDNDTKVEIVSL